MTRKKAERAIEGVPVITAADQEAAILQWLREPFSWAQAFLGAEFDPWSGQQALWEAYGRVLNAKLKRYQRGAEALTPEEAGLADKMGITVMSGHGLGKERTITGIGLHYLYMLSAYRVRGVCTAPVGPTLRSTMWPEFEKVMAESEPLRQMFTKQADRIYLSEDRDQGKFMRIEPRTIQTNSSPDEQGVVLAGIHATGVIYLITEASGVPEPVFRPIEGGLTDPLSLMILIFNPTRRTGFAAESHTVNRQHWVCLHWDARELKKEKGANPGRFKWFNERAQDVLIAKYGEDSDTVRIRVIGLPPKQASDTLIHYEAAMDAVARDVLLQPEDPLSIGVDVGGGGTDADPSIITVMRGPKLLRLIESQLSDFRLADQVVDIFNEELALLPEEVQTVIMVDYMGLGRVIYNALVETHRLQNVVAVDVAEAAIRSTEFHRLRDEVWWELREAFMVSKTIAVDPDLTNLDALISQLTSIKWASVFFNASSKIKVQGKGSSSGIPGIKPLAHSPNEADSLALAWRGYRHHCSRVASTVQKRPWRASYGRQVESWKIC